jgi:hypothetical protein
LSASPDPDRAEQSVPYAIDGQEVFFGPCKKRLRERLRDEFLSEARTAWEPEEDIYLIGFNGSNGSATRKIVWAGRVKRVMTFARAHADLLESRYERLTSGSAPPLHVRPVHDGQGRLIAYSKVGTLHAQEWARDLVQRPNVLPPDCVSPKRLSVPRGFAAWDAFDRDACLLLENTFYATRGGIAISQRILDLLRVAQPKRDVDDYAIFGRRPDGSPDGRVGGWLLLNGEVTKALVSIIKREAKRLPRGPFDENTGGEHCYRSKPPKCAPKKGPLTLQRFPVERACR